MQSRKSLIISTYDDIKNPHYGGGGAIAVHALAKRLAKKYDITVLSWDYSGKKREIIDGVRYERFGFPSLSPKLAMFVYQLGLPFVAQHKQFDIWLESFCPPFTTAFLPLFIKKPVVGMIHMLAAEDMERKYHLPFHLVQNQGIKTYKQLIATSVTIKEKISEIHQNASITVISNGIDSFYKPTLRKQKNILFLGRIEIDQKGLDLLIESFKKFHHTHADYLLTIAGSGDAKEIIKLRSLVKEAGLSKFVHFKGKIAGKIKESLIRSTACLVIPSRFETFSLVALEAMASGAPVICFAINGLSWIPKKAAKRIKPFDTNAFAKGLSEILLQKEQTNVMIKEGNTYAKQFTWDSIAKKYDEYISLVLSA